MSRESLHDAARRSGRLRLALRAGGLSALGLVIVLLAACEGSSSHSYYDRFRDGTVESPVVVEDAELEPPPRRPQPAQMADASPTQVLPAPSAVSVSAITAGQRFAIVIGLSQYQDSRIPPLRYASADATAFYDWLVAPDGGRYPPAHVLLLLDADATTANIREALFTWAKQPIEEDMLTIYIACHGSPEAPDSVENLFLLSYDTDYDNIAATAFPMWDIETALRRFIKARKVIVVADACHAGGVGAGFDSSRRGIGGVEAGLVSSGIQELSVVGDGVAVLTASGAKQMSQEGAQWGGGHGVFTHFLLTGLKGEADYNADGTVTLGELIPYLSEKVRRETQSAQSPEIAGRFDPAISIGH